MAETTILPDPPDHVCPLPWRSGGYGSTGLPDRTLWRCPDCLTWWWSAPCYEHFGPVSRWHRVWWFHWRLRRRIKSKAVIARTAPARDGSEEQG